MREGEGGVFAVTDALGVAGRGEHVDRCSSNDVGVVGVARDAE